MGAATAGALALQDLADNRSGLLQREAFLEIDWDDGFWKVLE